MPHPLLVPLAGMLAQIQLPNVRLDPRTNILLGSVLGVLAMSYFVGRALRRQPESTANPAVIRTFNLRVRAWWMMYVVLIAGLILGYVATVVLFGLISFWALREFITMTPTRRGDHRTLFWTFVVFTPLQYILVGLNAYALYTVMIPVYASLFVPARIAISGDPKRFLERVAKIQSALLICVYCLSHAPAILSLVLTNAPGGPNAPRWVIGNVNDEPVLGSNASVLFFFVLMVQLNDVLQYMWGQLLGKHVIAPQINASRTWEGLVGGTLSTMLAGMLLSWATPFGPFWAGPIAGAVALAGFAGSMTMSGIKRDRGVKDYGTLVSGHAGVLDRIDSLCFAAPVFFHITRYFFT
jgi:phosphatidate cytidylyltransferase